MPYAALDDLIERAGASEISEVADRDGDGVPDADVIGAALTTADTTIASYLAVRYAVPLATVPDVVRKWAVAIARYNLHRDGAPDHVVRDYKDALAELKDAGAGRLLLPDASGVQPTATPEAGAVHVSSAAPVFDDRGLDGWR